MDKIIVIKNLDGSCAIVNPAPNLFDITSRDRIELNDKGILSLSATDDEIMEFVISKSNLEGKEFRITDKSNIPQDRVFRNAWTDDNNTETVDIHIEKAQEIKKNNFRELRKPILEKLDADYMKALEASDIVAQQEIANKKQLLRDVTDLPLPTDIEDLKTFIPDILKS